MIILALVITGIAYFVFPLIYVHTNGKVDNKKAWKIAIINFIICHMIFIGIAVSVGMDGGSASAAPVLWLFLTQAYMHDKNKDGLVAQKKKELPKPTPEHKNYQAKTTSDFKTKMMNVSKDLIYKWAVAGVIITAIVIFIFAMSLGDAKKFGERDICESATTITTTGNNSFQYRSINKNYTVYMIATGNEYIFGKSKNTIYIVQETDSGLKAYKVANSYANKGNILNYFNTVKEVDNLPTSLVAGGLLAATIIVPSLLGLATVALWVWWYFLNEEEKKVRLNKSTSAAYTASQQKAPSPSVSATKTSGQIGSDQRLVDKGVIKPTRAEKTKFKPILPLEHSDYFTNTYTKVMRIKNNPSDTAGFGEAEILKEIVDIDKAKKVLSAEDYNCVKQIYDFFDSHWKLNLTYQEYIDKCFDIVSHFDMITTYWKFAGNLFPLKVKFVQQDKEKEPYRSKAKKLLAKPRNEKTIMEKFPDTIRQMMGKSVTDFSPDLVDGWKELNDEFYDTFYAQGFAGDSVLNIYNKQDFEEDSTEDEVVDEDDDYEDEDDDIEEEVDEEIDESITDDEEEEDEEEEKEDIIVARKPPKK